MPSTVQRKRLRTVVKLRKQKIPAKKAMQILGKIPVKMAALPTIPIGVRMGATGNRRIVGKLVFLLTIAHGVKRIEMLKKSISPSTVLIKLSSNQR